MLRINGMLEATSPTETAWNQIAPGFVRENDLGSIPSRSTKCGWYARLVSSRATKYKATTGSESNWMNR